MAKSIDLTKNPKVAKALAKLNEYCDKELKKNRQSVALLGFGAKAPELFECGNGVYELDVNGKTYRFKAKDTADALEKCYDGEYKRGK